MADRTARLRGARRGLSPGSRHRRAGRARRMERQSDKHGRRLDEAMEHEVEPETTLSRRAVRARSDLAVHLRPSIFPATAEVVIACAQEEGAPPDLIDALMTLPWGATFHTTEEVWEALGGHTEHRPSHLEAP